MRIHSELGRNVVGAVVITLFVACAGDRRGTTIESAQDASGAPIRELVAAPWTSKFLEESVLAAARVEIVGPIGLRGHVVILQDSLRHEHRESTTTAGYSIEQRQKPESDGTPIKAHLDALTILADDSLTVLETPNAREVTINAVGEVYFRVVRSGEETRGASLRLIGAP